MSLKHIRLIDEEIDAYEDAAGIVEDDLDIEDPDDGEIIEHLANAYRGKL